MSQDSSESLWRKLVELLETTLSLGRTYRHIGDVKRVKCYLKEGLALSRKFGLLKWYVHPHSDALPNTKGGNHLSFS